MTTEMLSGPDLGAGYLHQLSIDRDEDRTTFTFHAQEGGADANGPPKGPLDVFGFVHPPSPCMFGGPRCWHRRFLLPFSETSRVRHGYNRNRFVLQTMLDQAYDHAPVALDATIQELVDRIAAPLSRDRIDWYVGGSAAAWVLGAPVSPNDVDLGTSREGVDRIAALLAEYLIEPLAPTDWPSAGIVRGARAFVGTFQRGTRVEWAVPLEPRAAAPFEEWSGRPASVRLLEASYRGRTMKVTRPEYALVRAYEKHRPQDASAIAAVVRRMTPDGELLDALLGRSALSVPERQSIRRDVIGEFLG
jgi:hypothetical protein